MTDEVAKEELAVDKVRRGDLESFLRNVPHPVLLGVFGKNCAPCEEMEEEIARKPLPQGMTYAKVTLGNEPEDIEIADLLGLEEVPTAIAFCQGEEVARTTDPEELDSLLNDLHRCQGGKNEPAS